MNFPRRVRIELLVCMVLLPCLSEARRSPRGFRASTRRTWGHEQHRDLQMNMDKQIDTWSPTQEPTLSPSFTTVPTLSRVEGAKGNELTGGPLTAAPTNEDLLQEGPPTAAPTNDDEAEDPQQAKEDDTEEPTAPPVTATPGTGAPTDAPTVGVAKTPEPTAGALLGATEGADETPLPTLMPTITSTTQQPVDPLPDETVTVTAEPTSSSTSIVVNVTEVGPYTIQLDPLYLFITMQGDTNEEGFMEVLIDYMEYNMARDFEGFESVTYSVSTFGMITKYPSISRAVNETTLLGSPISNVTVHIHLLTATFEEKPRQPDLVLTEYMEMLLENEEMMQDYIDTQPGMDATILSVDLEFEDTAVNPTATQNGTTPDAATEEESENKHDNSNTGTIVGWTVGAFVVLLWVVILYGIQSRSMSPSE